MRASSSSVVVNPEDGTTEVEAAGTDEERTTGDEVVVEVETIMDSDSIPTEAA